MAFIHLSVATLLYFPYGKISTERSIKYPKDTQPSVVNQDHAYESSIYMLFKSKYDLLISSSLWVVLKTKYDLLISSSLWVVLPGWRGATCLWLLWSG